MADIRIKIVVPCYVKQTMTLNGWEITPEYRIIVNGSGVEITHTHGNYYNVSGITSIKIVGKNILIYGSNAPVSNNAITAPPTVMKQSVVKKSPNKFYYLKISLEDIFNGCTKKIPVTRSVFSSDGTPRIENATFSINIKPGCQNGTKYIFRHAGDRMTGCAQGDIIVVVQDMPHPHFVRDGSNICYIQKITFKQALFGTVIDVPTLDGKLQKLWIKPVVLPFSTRKLVGHGLPNPQADNKKRGDIIVKFKIKFF